ncbi:DUF4166 domain-containing protein [Lacisediminihabitans sp. FW035]
MSSPYEEVFGAILDSLHPRLRAYFGEIPPGTLGVGVGVFDVVGTPRRWLWPVLRLLASDGIAFPGWHRGVPFTVVNRPLRDDHGNVAVAAERSFGFESGNRQMVDAITSEDAALVDHLGRARRLVTRLSGRVVNGGLVLSSTVLAVRVGRVRVIVPRLVAPRVSLHERFDESDDRQHVSVVVSAPLIGRLYEYSGSFTYRIESAP